jgi:hypothetical protein
MATVTEILAAQAKAVREGRDKLTVADHLEAAAKLIRMEAAAPKKTNFVQDLRDKRKNQAEKFSKDVAAARTRDLDDRLKRGGWLLGQTETATGIRHYGDPKRPGLRMKIQGGKFSIHYHNELKIDKQELNYLDTFLKKQDQFLSIKRP